MSKSIEELFTEVRELFRELGNIMVSLASLKQSEIIDDSAVRELIEQFRPVFDQTRERLDHPTLSIATLGTTSSGKSTIVNALIGRKIAPILNDEMSGGVLRIKHGKQSVLIIKGEESKEGEQQKTGKSKQSRKKRKGSVIEQARWESGTWRGLSDAQMYERIKSVMERYHKLRKDPECPAPDVAVWDDLLPVNNHSLLNLPQGIDIEFVDLPGLKSVDDVTNLRVIQSEFKKSCCLVSLSYDQVDERHRQALLKELKDVISDVVGGYNTNDLTQQDKIASIIFVLNKVDVRVSDDRPLDQQIKKLQEEIQSALFLKNPPTIIPFTARLLFLAQCAWGTGLIEDASGVASNLRLEYLESVFKECNNVIEQKTWDDDDLEDWFKIVKRKVKRGSEIDDQTMRQFLHHATEWSGGQELWQMLRQRIDTSFTELVLVPSLRPLLTSLDVLIAQLNLQVKNSIHEKTKEVNQLLNQLQNQQSELKGLLKKTREDIDKQINHTFRVLASAEFIEEENRLIDEIDELEALIKTDDLVRAVAKVCEDLNVNIIIFLEEALEEGRSGFDLKDDLEQQISPFHAESLGRAYDRVQKIQKEFSHQRDRQCFYKSVKSNDQKGVNCLDDAEKYYKTLYTCVDKALSNEAELSIQKQCSSITAFVESFSEKYHQAILADVASIFPDLVDVIEAEFNKVIELNFPELPESFFSLSSEKIKAGTKSIMEQTGTKTEIEHYTETILFFFKFKRTRPIERAIHENVQYHELELPDNEAVVEQWLQGISVKKSKILATIENWIQDYFHQLSNQFDDVIDRTLELTKDSLERRKRLKENELEEFKQYWRKVENRKDQLAELQNKFNQLINE
ncbi:dynamin family protein [Spirulina sp. CCNP1310]|uniref:dynamin family protein n=1 Tax=Spirulina sp. CCNP1310 TaxID=3110249 RepID=UPI002B21F424|nr:dynamin family protein [Spirulina sp. CCNP1310]MEA5421495.1 dynamin family protein [Spirulina sp. CCNP1310]